MLLRIVEGNSTQQTAEHTRLRVFAPTSQKGKHVVTPEVTLNFPTNPTSTFLHLAPLPLSSFLSSVDKMASLARLRLAHRLVSSSSFYDIQHESAGPGFFHMHCTSLLISSIFTSQPAHHSLTLSISSIAPCLPPTRPLSPNISRHNPTPLLPLRPIPSIHLKTPRRLLPVLPMRQTRFRGPVDKGRAAFDV